jgi:hypothetical protein
MTLAASRFTFLGLCALALTACQAGEDAAPMPRYVTSYGKTFVAGQPAGTMTRAAELSQGQYFIEFRSRYALTYGHTYVVFGRVNAAGAMINPEVAGLAPASHSAVPYVLGHFVPVPSETGWSDGDLEEQYRSASWRVLLNEAEYRDVVAYIRKLQASSPVWQASVYNCNAFVADIARHMGYKAPGIWNRPQQFITQLREMNT